jgi:hypothetical protein
MHCCVVWSRLPPDTIIHVFEFFKASKYEKCQPGSLVQKCFGRFLDGSVRRLFSIGTSKNFQRYKIVEGWFSSGEFTEFLSRVNDEFPPVHRFYNIVLYKNNDCSKIPNHSTWRIEVYNQIDLHWDTLESLEHLANTNLQLHLDIGFIHGIDTWKRLNEIIHLFHSVELSQFHLNDLKNVDNKIIPENLVPYIKTVRLDLKNSIGRQYDFAISQCINLKRLFVFVRKNNDHWFRSLCDPNKLKASKLHVDIRRTGVDEEKLYFDVLMLCARNHNIKTLILEGFNSSKTNTQNKIHLQQCFLESLVIIKCKFCEADQIYWTEAPKLKQIEWEDLDMDLFFKLESEKNYFSSKPNIRFELTVSTSVVTLEIYEQLIQIFHKNLNIDCLWVMSIKPLAFTRDDDGVEFWKNSLCMCRQ